MQIIRLWTAGAGGPGSARHCSRRARRRLWTTRVGRLPGVLSPSRRRTWPWPLAVDLDERSALASEVCTAIAELLTAMTSPGPGMHGLALDRDPASSPSTGNVTLALATVALDGLPVFHRPCTQWQPGS
jgi:hypothetical protein